MKSLLIAAAAAFVAGAANAAPPPPADAVALRLLGVAADEAWNAKDAERMATYYAEDATLLVAGAGGLTEGREAVRRYFARAFAGRVGDLRHVSELKAMTALSPDLVFNDVEVRVEERQADGGWKVLRRFNNVSVAAREGGAWRLRSVRAYPVG